MDRRKGLNEGYLTDRTNGGVDPLHTFSSGRTIMVKYSAPLMF